MTLGRLHPKFLRLPSALEERIFLTTLLEARELLLPSCGSGGSGELNAAAALGIALFLSISLQPWSILINNSPLMS